MIRWSRAGVGGAGLADVEPGCWREERGFLPWVCGEDSYERAEAGICSRRKMRRREVWMLMVALQVGICPFVASTEPAAGAPEPPQLRGESLEMRTSRLTIRIQPLDLVQVCGENRRHGLNRLAPRAGAPPAESLINPSGLSRRAETFYQAALSAAVSGHMRRQLRSWSVRLELRTDSVSGCLRGSQIPDALFSTQTPQILLNVAEAVVFESGTPRSASTPGCSEAIRD